MIASRWSLSITAMMSTLASEGEEGDDDGRTASRKKTMLERKGDLNVLVMADLDLVRGWPRRRVRRSRHRLR